MTCPGRRSTTHSRERKPCSQARHARAGPHLSAAFQPILAADNLSVGCANLKGNRSPAVLAAGFGRQPAGRATPPADLQLSRYLAINITFIASGECAAGPDLVQFVYQLLTNLTIANGGTVSIKIPPPPDSGQPQSPFTPTFGSTPPAVVGRQTQVDDFAYALDSGAGAKGRATFVTGQRGVGKSVMLNVFHEVAASRSWMGLHAQASPGFVETMTQARLPEVLQEIDTVRTLKSKTVGANVSVLGFGGGMTTRTEETNQLVPDFRHQLMRVLDILDKRGSGLLITLDEVHRSQAGQIQVVTDAIAYAFAQRAPVAFVAAGLPETINGLVNGHVSTYLRRAERVILGNLTTDETRVAIEQPLKEAGRSITPEALDLAVAGTGNYPYLVQLAADEAWRASVGGDIRESHVLSALDTAERSMYRQIHEPMIESVSDRERQYLYAMTPDPERSQTGEIASRMQISQQHGSVYRDRLINHGLIESDGRGYVKFTVPYSRDYLLTQVSHNLGRNIDSETAAPPGKHARPNDGPLPLAKPQSVRERVYERATQTLDEQKRARGKDSSRDEPKRGPRR